MACRLISSYGTLPGMGDATQTVVASTKPYDILCSSLELRLDPEECNYHTLNTRAVTGLDCEIDVPRYEYSALPEAGYVRLLDFAVIVEDNKKYIFGRLREYSFEEAAKIGYNALSYAWGDPYRTHHLMCVDESHIDDPSRIPITANLADWFRQREAGVHFFWFDAVCINLADKVERARQVGQMREVYQNADNVVAWLGGISPLHAFPTAKSTADDLARDTNTIRALSLYRRDMSIGLLRPWKVVFPDQGYQFGSHQHLELLLDYLRIRCDMLRGHLLRLYHEVKSRLDPTHSNTFSMDDYRCHYTAARPVRSAVEHPAITLLRRPYFTRRWIILDLGSAHDI